MSDIIEQQDILVQRTNTDNELFFVAGLPYHDLIQDSTPSN